LIVHKTKNIKNFFLIFAILIITVISLMVVTPGLRGDIEQSLRILLKQPILLKSKNIKENKLQDYFYKLLNGIENRVFNPTKFDNLKIDIKFSELEKLREDRKKALKFKKLINPQKVALKITHNGKKYDATARLKGDFSEHWGNMKQWSLKIKLRQNKTIFSMNEFSITVFGERDFPYNFVITEILRQYDVLVPRYKTVEIDFNGVNWGLMLLEEQFSESFYAQNKLKEAPIFKITNENHLLIKSIADKELSNIEDIINWQGKIETNIYNENNILKKTNIPFKNTNATLVSIFKNLQEIIVLKDQNYLPQINRYIDISSFANVAAITAIFGDWHSHLPMNSRYYLNPYDLKVKPIITDSTHSKIDENFFTEHNFFYKNVFFTESFQEEYFKTLNDIKNNFKNIEKHFEITCKDFGKSCKDLVDLRLIKENIDFLIYQDKNIFERVESLEKNHKKIFNTKNFKNINKKKINFRAFDNGDVFVDNLTSENLLITDINLFNKKKCETNCKKITKSINSTLEPSTFENLKTKKIKFDSKNIVSRFLEINYLDEKNISFSQIEKIEKNHLIKEKFFNKKNLTFNKNLIKDKKNYILKQGIYIINEPIIIPSGFNLVIEEGVKIYMAANSYIYIEDGLAKFNGTKINPINIFSIDKDFKWKGIYVNSDSIEEDFSIFNNVNISNYSYFDDEIIQLTGGINFINGNVKILNSTITNSVAEDAINLVNAKFEIHNIIISNSISDGIDVDFGRGEITNSKFINISGDAIDTSGSVIKIKDIKFSNIEDKAISAGEESSLELHNINITSSKIGIASKDSSVVEVTDIKISNCKLFDFAVYQKKSYFSGAFLKIYGTSNCNKSLVQNKSELIINDKKIPQEKFNIRKLYDGTL
jgi:hypothetical protein